MTQRRLSPDSYNQRVNDWDGDGATDFTFPLRTPDELRSRYINDNERTVIALLRSSKPNHPHLESWLVRLTEDLAYTENAPEFSYDDSYTRRQRAIDGAILLLGLALIEHRMAGEEGHRDGFPLGANEVPPLTSAIVRYHEEIATAYAAELQRVRRGIE